MRWKKQTSPTIKAKPARTLLLFGLLILLGISAWLGSYLWIPSPNWDEMSHDLCLAKEKDQPITLYTGGTIQTMDAAQPTADWVAVQCGMIVAVGEGTPPTTIRGLSPQFDLRFSGQVILPGFIDPHLHPMLAAVLLPTHFITPEDWNLPRGFEAGVKTPNAYWAKLKNTLDAAPDDSPFITWGWHALWHGPMTRDLLDQIENTRPVIVWQRSFHEIIANSKAMALLGAGDQASFEKLIDQVGVDPSHASYEKGFFSETALAVAIPKLAPTLMAPKHLDRGFDEMKAMLRQSGITTISDMATGIFGGTALETGLIIRAFGSQKNPVRVMLMQFYTAEPGSEQKSTFLSRQFLKAKSKKKPAKIFYSNRIKLLADGAFFVPAMKLKQPEYLDGREGKWITKPDRLEELAIAAWNKGKSLHIHVNGDAGLDAVLSLIAKLPRDGTYKDQQIVLEHLGIAREDQIARIAELSLMVSAQPNYLYVVSGKYAGTLLDKQQAAEMVRLGSLERAGIPLALHSDLIMAPAQPLLLAWIAVNRINMDGQLMAPEQRISVETAMRAITIDAARITGMDNEIGSIEIGKRADFTVLAENPYTVDPMHLKDIEVTGVMFEGTWFPNDQP